MADAFVIVVWGDSIAAGSGWPDRAQHIFNAALNTGTSIRVVNESVGGKPAAVARYEFDARIVPHEPDLVVIQFGFNDLRYDGSRGKQPISTLEEFADHLRHMVSRCTSELAAQVLLVTNHVPQIVLRMPDGRSYAETVNQYNDLTRRVAAETNVLLLDMWQATTAGRVASAAEVVNEDGVHLSPRGTNVYAWVMADVFQRVVNLSSQAAASQANSTPLV